MSSNEIYCTQPNNIVTKCVLNFFHLVPVVSTNVSMSEMFQQTFRTNKTIRLFLLPVNLFAFGQQKATGYDDELIDRRPALMQQMHNIAMTLIL